MLAAEFNISIPSISDAPVAWSVALAVLLAIVGGTILLVRRLTRRP